MASFRGTVQGNKRVKWVYDEDPDLSDLEQWNTPETYQGYEVYEDGEPLSFKNYMQTYGNPERHVVLGCVIERECPHCGKWSGVESLWGIDFMDWQPWEIGTYQVDEIDTLNDYQQAVSLELLAEGGEE